MTDRAQRASLIKHSKSRRRAQTDRRRANPLTRVNEQLPHGTDISLEHSSTNVDNDFIKAFIANLTSDGDDPPMSPVNETSTVIKTLVSSQPGDESSTFNRFGDKGNSNRRGLSTGEERRDKLTKLMKNLYKNCFEFDSKSNANSIADNFINPDKRKQYSTNLW